MAQPLRAPDVAHAFRGDLHLFGHSHGTMPPIPGSLDVGVHCWGWIPVTLPQIQRLLAERLPRGPIVYVPGNHDFW